MGQQVGVPQTVRLTPELEEIRNAWEAADGERRSEIFAREFAPKFAPLFADLPLHGAVGDLRPVGALVSILGLSWQPIALLAAWARPKKMLVLATERSLSASVSGRSVLELIETVAKLDRDAIHYELVSDQGEQEIYERVRDFQIAERFEVGSMYVDPTGGKKSMSAAVALAAFWLGAPLIYVDYREYLAEGRIPRPGTEYPRLLDNPLDSLGERDLAQARKEFNAGAFESAARLIGGLEARLYASAHVRWLRRLCEGYGAWHEFDFSAAEAAFGDALAAAAACAPRRRPESEVVSVVRSHLSLVSALAAARDSAADTPILTLIVRNHVAAAARAMGYARTGESVLLLYAALEKLTGILLRSKLGLDPDQVSWDQAVRRVGETAVDRARSELGSAWSASRSAHRVPFKGRFLLLAASGLLSLDPGVARAVVGLVNVRNRCQYEHGILSAPPDRQDVGRIFERCTELVDSVLRVTWNTPLGLQELAFPVL